MDVVVVYKIDRLSRALMDFARLTLLAAATVEVILEGRECRADAGGGDGGVSGGVATPKPQAFRSGFGERLQPRSLPRIFRTDFGTATTPLPRGFQVTLQHPRQFLELALND